MTSNILTIFRKECARFFGDKGLFFTGVLMPGLIIYITYTFIGNGLQSQIGPVDPVEMADDIAMGRSIWGNILPMLILMLLFSGIMAMAPSTIAGEKERGTIATLLVTPMRRSELAWGKVLSLSLFALLSGVSSFLGVMLSLPRMMGGGGIGMGQLSAGDYAALLVVILSTVLVLVGCVANLSALAKDVRSAGTLVMPLMFVVMVVGLLPMLGVAGGAWYWSLVPVYNSVEAMGRIFAGQVDWVGVALTMVSNVGCLLATVWSLTRLLGSERVMFGK